jgi:thioredoxin reductase
MTIEHIETAIIGAGQAGLATGYHLKRRGREFLIVDGGFIAYLGTETIGCDNVVVPTSSGAPASGRPSTGSTGR